ncbi:XdhC family protein [Nocardia sp. CNY236]|uniref:XdhC family protein n=1 Tax=Nocardia sp. CNY236 TaxID=1169152 RepID=UPI0004275486|nr:XdhC/CoxI family protein [Nocardia sp. CNY236]
MRDIIDDLLRVWHSNRAGGLATVVRTEGPASVPVGSTLLVDAEGGVSGSLAAEELGEVAYEETLRAARTGRRRIHRLDVAGMSGNAEGAEAGAEALVDVFTEPFSRTHFPEFPAVAAEIVAHRRVTVFTVVWNPDTDLIGQHLVTNKKHATELVSLADSDVFVASFAPPPRLIIFGANSFAAALSEQAGLLGYRVTVCDSRPAFATSEMFPGAEVVVDWPHRYLNTLSSAGEIHRSTAIVIASQDPAFEIPLLTVALQLPELGYLGAMGSRRTHTRRITDLRAGGFNDETLARLRSPAGLDIGARTAPELAVAIAAELLAVATAHTTATDRRPRTTPSKSALRLGI